MRDDVRMGGIVVDREGGRVADYHARIIGHRIGNIQYITRIEVQRERVRRAAVHLADLATGQVERRIDIARSEIYRLYVGQRRQQFSIAYRARVGRDID